MYILATEMYILTPKMDKSLPFEKVQPQWQLYTFFSECIYIYTHVHVYLRKKNYVYIKLKIFIYKSICSIYMEIFLKYIQACVCIYVYKMIIHSAPTYIM